MQEPEGIAGAQPAQEMGPQVLNEDTAESSAIAIPVRAKGRSPEQSGFFGGLQYLASTIVIAIFVILFVAQAFQIPSESMEDTLLIGDYLLVDKMQYGPEGGWRPLMPYREVKRGEIVVFKWPLQPSQHFVKRVVGLPGDRIRIERNKVFINGRLFEDAHAVFKPTTGDSDPGDFPGRAAARRMTEPWRKDVDLLTRHREVLIPEGSYFVLGDNRNNSYDSRYWGLVPRENVIGRPLLIYFSYDRNGAAPAGGRAEQSAGFTARLFQIPASARWRRTFRLVQ